MEFDPLLLGRIQFAFTVSFHILFPAFTIGLAAWLAVLIGLEWGTGRPVYARLAKLWTKIFAVSFGMGVVSGIVLSFQFGTNWSEFSLRTGNILGPLMSYEVMTAFFLEATFLGVLLFGRNRVPKGIYFLSALIVSIGTLGSAFWILSANSWMHTPAGFTLDEEGIFYAADWWQIVFNPSFPYRLAHMVTAAFLVTSFVVAGASAWYLVRDRETEAARVGLKMALGMIVVLAPAQILIGDLHGLNTLEHQPAKVAAMEGHWEERIEGAPLILFGMPDMTAETTHYAVGIPWLGSLILKHSPTATVQGLKAWPPEERPYAPIVFWSFRVMVGLGFLFLAIAVASVWLQIKGRLFTTRWFHRALVWTIPLPFVAMLAGWFTTEIGRQPYVVYGHLLTADAVSPSVTMNEVTISLAAFVIAYGLIFPAGLYYIIRLIRRGPEPEDPRVGVSAEGSARRPLSGADESLEPAE